MQWEGRRESSNVEDRRTLTPGRMAAGGGIGVVLLALLVAYLGGDPRVLLNQLPEEPPPGQQQRVDPAQDEAKKFVSVVLADTEDVWNKQFREMGKTYR